MFSDEACCLDCRYPLKGLPESRCPECGRAFDPSDPETFRSSDGPSFWQSWGRPPGRTHAALALLTTAAVVYGTSAPWPSLSSAPVLACFLLLTPIIWLCLLIDWGLRLYACSTASSAARDVRPRWAPRGVWLLAPICIVAIVAAVGTSWPLRVRFAISRPALERAAAEALAGRNPAGDRWIGLYYVERIEAPGNTAFWFRTGDGFIDPVGFEYDLSSAGPRGRGLRLTTHWRVAEW
jgi:hypothetical protein